MASEPLQRPKSTTTIFLDQPPSCLEFCPAAPNHFIVGTYLLSETKTEDGDIQQDKTGSVQLWKLDTESIALYEPDPVNSRLVLTFLRSLIQRIPVPYAVFDLHFHSTDPDLFAIASSTGSVDLFQLVASESSDPEIKKLWTLSVHEDPSTPALFLAWAPRGWFLDDRDGFAVTFSDGRTSVFGTSPGKNITEQGNVSELGSFDARQTIEVWFVALAKCRGDSADGVTVDVPYLLTGNDFGSLHTRRFNTSLVPGEEEDDDEEKTLPSLLLDHDDRGRHHSAGVTSILPLPLPLVDDAPILLTGNYDEYLRVYQATMKGKVLAEVCLGGGVWRLQLLRREETASLESEVGEWRFLVLASCMHAGTRVVRVTRRVKGEEVEWEMDILAEFTEHESMNYASGVWKGSKRGEMVCVSSSFYDRRLCLWRVEV